MVDWCRLGSDLLHGFAVQRDKLLCEKECMCVYCFSGGSDFFFSFFGVMGNETASQDAECVSMLKC